MAVSLAALELDAVSATFEPKLYRVIKSGWLGFFAVVVELDGAVDEAAADNEIGWYVCGGL